MNNELINKTLSSLKKDGIIKTLKKAIRLVKIKLLSRKKKNIINDYVNVNDFETIIVFENNFGWNKIMKQRPQQIAGNLPPKTLMFYHSHEDNDYNNKKRINKLSDNLILIDLGYYRDKLMLELNSHNNKYLMIYSTDYIPFDRIEMYKKSGYELVYEFVDDFNADLSGKKMYTTLCRRHEKIKNLNPTVICTANELLNKCKNEGFMYTKLITNGVDCKHFRENKNSIPKDLIDIRKKYKYLICYYGALASWFDYELIKQVAKDKDYGIILLGQDYDSTLEKSGVLNIENVHYLGKKKYDELPNYGHNVDVFIIPFIINDITKATSPVKIFEYMAMEKPIVTTALPECKKYKSVLYSDNHNDFINNLKKAINLIGDDNYKKLLRKEADDNTWESKANDLVDFANSCRYSKLETEVSGILEDNTYDRVIVWRSPFGWNVPLFQRPQHIAKQLSKQNCLVFYEITNKTDNVKNIEKVSKNLYLVNFENYYVNLILKNKLKSIKTPKYLQFYSTNWSMSIEELNAYQEDGFDILYEYIDDISPDLAGTDEIPPYILDKYNYAIKNDEVLIVTTAKALYEDVKNKRGTENLVLSCNGVDYNFFQKIDKNYEFEKDLLKVINNGKLNVCYYGALANWFDYDLIKKLNETNDYNIILFGVKYDSSYDESHIHNLKNVHFFGPKDYSILKNYANKMDVLTIPFVINSITRATSPLKLFEYMALHKPIVTTAMDECKNYKSVLIGNNHQEFISQLNKCKRMKNDKKYLSLLDKEARENDWSSKAKIIVDLLKEKELEKKDEINK